MVDDARAARAAKVWEVGGPAGGEHCVRHQPACGPYHAEVEPAAVMAEECADMPDPNATEAGAADDEADAAAEDLERLERLRRYEAIPSLAAAIRAADDVLDTSKQSRTAFKASLSRAQRGTARPTLDRYGAPWRMLPSADACLRWLAGGLMVREARAGDSWDVNGVASAPTGGPSTDRHHRPPGGHGLCRHLRPMENGLCVCEMGDVKGYYEARRVTGEGTSYVSRVDPVR